MAMYAYLKPLSKCCVNPPCAIKTLVTSRGMDYTKTAKVYGGIGHQNVSSRF